jgi:sterol desaturase/sphingolipid hydroxylase (fatty acid hydroxylase superfamily)
MSSWSEQLHFANGAQGAAVLALPLLGLALIAELVFSWRRRDGHYDRRDTLTNFALYVGNALTARLWGPLALFMYGLGHRYHLVDLPAALSRFGAGWTWLALFLLDDFFYYWSHRAAHHLPVLWASHVVHHSSTRFNLSVATRHSWTGGLTDWVFWMPIALLGFTPLQIVSMQGLSLIWQFAVHTPYKLRLGPLDWLLNTPSHHRVHHGRNPEYLDRNFAGVLIVWDRLFGSFAAERAPVEFGTRQPPARPYNPLFIATYGWRALLAPPAARAPRPGS